MRYKIEFINKQNKYYETTFETAKNKIADSLYDLLMFAHKINWEILLDVKIIKKIK